MRSSRWFAALLAVTCLALVGSAIADEKKAMDEKPAEKAKKLDFELPTLDGKKVKLSDMKDKYVVLEWIEPKCPYCVRHAKDKTMNHLVKHFEKRKDVVIMGVLTSRVTDVAAMKAFKEEYKLQYPIVVDADGKVGKMFGATNTPHMFVVKNGDVVYQGALDNDPRGRMEEEKRVNYIAKAVDAAIAGKKVEVAKTKPYG